MSRFLISIVVPCYNEAENLPVLVEQLSAVLKAYAFEILLVNDGSIDETQEVIEWLSHQNSAIKYLSLSRNFGHQMALKAGLEHALGDCVVTMDADLQHPPQVILQMIALWQEGYMQVVGLREKQNQPSLVKRMMSIVFYRLMTDLTDKSLKTTGSDFRLLDKKMIALLRQMPEKDLYLRGLFAWMGFKQTTVLYREEKRLYGKSKYSWLKMLRLAGNGITSYSIKPLRMALTLGILFALLAFSYGLYAVIMVFLGHTVPGWASLLAASMFLAGIQFIVLGVMGEYLGKLYMAVKQRPDYLVEKTNMLPLHYTNENRITSKPIKTMT